MRQPYSIGELRERVTITRTTETQDAYGTLVQTTTTLADSIPALVRPLSGREADRGQQVQPTALYLVVIRYRSWLTTKDVLIWRGVTFDIRVISDRGPGSQFLEVQAERRG